MKQVISVRDLEEMVRSGRDVRSLPADALLTPSARDFVRDLEGNGVYQAPAAVNGKPSVPTKPVTSKSPKADIESFFNSPAIHALKEQICDIGRRLWQREYVDGNGGNIAIRVGEDIALCTPTLVSKGFMKPEDMCLVDLEGNQLAGTKKRTPGRFNASASGTRSSPGAPHPCRTTTALPPRSSSRMLDTRATFSPPHA